MKKISGTPRNNTSQNRSKAKMIIAIIAAGMAMIAFILYWCDRNFEKNFSFASPTSSFPDSRQWKESGDAQKTTSLAAISGMPVSGVISQRPDYVSEMEWQVLQNVARQNPDINLTNLVNKLLFNKKKQMWMSSVENTDQRRQLARQLLDMIPDQLNIEAIDSDTAKEMERKLAADLR